MSPHVTLPTKANVERPKAKGYDGFIGDLYIRLMIGPDTPFLRQTAQPTPDTFTTDANPEDFGETFGRTYSRVDFTGGEGLDQAHKRNLEDRDLSRYWDSRGIDIRSRPGSIQEINLLHDTELAEVDASDPITLVKLEGSLYWVSGQEIAVLANPTAPLPLVVDTENPHAGEGAQNVLDLTELGGNELYAAIATNGIHRRAVTATWTHWSDLAALRLWGVKGRVLASTGQSLYQADAADGSLLLHTLPSGSEWVDVADGGAAVLAAATDGHIYAFAEEGGALTLKAQTFIKGEIPQSILEAQGLIFYSTIQTLAAGGVLARWWRATLSESFTLAQGQVLRQWGRGAETATFQPSPMHASRDHVWLGISEAAETHLWRYDFVSAAVSRDLIFDAAGDVGGIVSEDDRLALTVAGAGLFRETTEYVAEGWLISPMADFYTARNKQWIGGRIWTRPVEATESAELAFTTEPPAIEDAEHGSWVALATVTAGAGGDEQRITTAESRWIAARITLRASLDLTRSPAVRGFAFRAYPGFDDVVLQLPVNVSDQVERPYRRRVRLNRHGESVFQALKGMEGRARAVEMFRPRLRVVGIVESVALPIRARTRRGSVSLVSMVQVRGVKQNPLGGEAGVGALGVGALGVETLGGAS